MSYTVKSKDKRSGITYVYEVESHWDKEKQQSRAKRTLIGKVDPVTGEIVATDGRGKKRSREIIEAPVQESPKPPVIAERSFYGATYLLDQIGAVTGITDDLKACFPDTYKQILSIAYYLILEDQNPLLRFRKWALLHQHPYHSDISSQRSSELFQSITEDQKMRFFRLQGKRRAEKEYWAYDTTSISSYSETLRQVRYGKNKDNDHLPQLNLALIFGQDSKLPFYYRKLAGNIPDVKTIHALVRDLDILGYGKVKIVMDRGFYSADNINALYRAHDKFVAGVTTTLSYAGDFIREIADKKDAYEYYDSNYELYVFTKTIAWNYEQKRPYKGDVINDERRAYLHLYFNPDKHADDGKALAKKLAGLKSELLTKKRVAAHEAAYQTYFTVKETPKRGVSVTVKQDAVDKARQRYGFFALLSNEVKDPLDALSLYRTRDVVEKAFFDVKERLNLKRTRISSESSLDGKLFVEFIALIYLSYIKRKMEEKGLFSKYTLHQLLDELDVIECFATPGKALTPGEVTTKQEQLYRDMDVTPLLAAQSI